MTLRELCREAEKRLADAGVEAPVCEVRELAGKFLSNDKEPDEKDIKFFFDAVQRRISGLPLQYIIGEWSFMGYDLYVGEGVLIPRDDTEVCVRGLLSELKKSGGTPKEIIDLCSGSGAIAIALAKLLPDSHISAVELSDKAWDYLVRNIARNNAGNVMPIKGDIGICCNSFEDESFDAVISNPPYVRTDEIPSLQKEISFEPSIALDGGNDGLDFYRIISEKWFPKLKRGGIMSLEIGETQADEVSALFEGKAEINVLKDIQELPRAVILKKR